MVSVKSANRSDVIARIAAAAVGGYALTIAVSACLSLLLPVTRAEALLTALLSSFVIYTAAIMWVFAVRSRARMWWGLGGATAGFAALSVLLSAFPA
jgi:hypothetical protein